MRRIFTVLALALMLSVSASAADISFNGWTVNIQSAGTGSATFTFNTFLGTEGYVGTPASLFFEPIYITPNTVTWTGGTTFITGPWTFAIGEDGTYGQGQLSGDLSWLKVTGDNDGNFALHIGITGMTYACTGTCTSNSDLASFGTAGGGSITFQFASGTPQTLDSLLNTSYDRETTFSGSISAVPEPASMALLGTGMLAGGRFIRRKFKR